MAFDPSLLPSRREINGFDVLPTSRVFVAYVGDEAVGTVRLTMPNAELAAQYNIDFGLPAAIVWDLRAVPTDARIVEINRVAVLSRFRGRGVIGPLYAAAHRAARAARYTHWIGTTLTGTDDECDAEIVAAVMSLRGGFLAAPRLLARKPAVGAGRRPLFDTRQRARAAQGDFVGFRLSPALRFHLRTQVTVIGRPLYDAAFAEYLVPIVADLSALARSEFGRLYGLAAEPDEPVGQRDSSSEETGRTHKPADNPAR